MPRATTDGGLRKIFRDHLPWFDWQSIESHATGGGIPDMNYCYGGVEGWLELKGVKRGNKPTFTRFQPAWIDRRVGAGGRVRIAVRVMKPGRDELWMFAGHQVWNLKARGLDEALSVGYWSGGPQRWDWKAVEEILTR